MTWAESVQLLNLLVLPAIYYVLRLERRLIIIQERQQVILAALAEEFPHLEHLLLRAQG